MGQSTRFDGVMSHNKRFYISPYACDDLVELMENNPMVSYDGDYAVSYKDMAAVIGSHATSMFMYNSETVPMRLDSLSIQQRSYLTRKDSTAFKAKTLLGTRIHKEIV